MELRSAVNALVCATTLVPAVHVSAWGEATAGGAGDPNLLKGKGIVVLAPNQFGATAVAYVYQAGDIPNPITIGFPSGYRGMIYLGFNAQGTWMYDRDEVYVLKGNALSRVTLSSVADVPGGLKNPSPQYLADHTGSVAGKVVPAITGKYGEDPNLPNARGDITVRPNPFNIKKLSYHYPAGSKSVPFVETGVPFPQYLNYLGYNDDGTWFSGGYVLKGDLLAKTPRTEFVANMLPLGLKNPQPEYFERFPPPQVLYRNLYGDDPNLPNSVGAIVLEPNSIGAQGIVYLYVADPVDLGFRFAGSESPLVSIQLKESAIDAWYLGHNAQGTWLQYGNDIYILKGKTLVHSDAKSTEQTPGDLRNGSRRYCSVHKLVYTPHSVPHVKEREFKRNADGTAWFSYTLETLQPGNQLPIETSGNVLVRPANPNAIAPSPLPSVALQQYRFEKAWVWVGEGSEKGQAALIFDSVPFVQVSITPDQVAKYLKP